MIPTKINILSQRADKLSDVSGFWFKSGQEILPLDGTIKTNTNRNVSPVDCAIVNVSWSFFETHDEMGDPLGLNRLLTDFKDGASRDLHFLANLTVSNYLSEAGMFASLEQLQMNCGLSDAEIIDACRFNTFPWMISKQTFDRIQELLNVQASRKLKQDLRSALKLPEQEATPKKRRAM